MDKILLVEDDVMIASGLKYALETEGYEVTHATDIHSAKSEIVGEAFSLAILDMQLPDGTGFDISGSLEDKGIPVIFLTVVDDESKIVKAFDEGADDYVVKPFRVRELLARVKRSLEKNKGETSKRITLGKVEVDTEAGKVYAKGNLVELTALEYRLLLIFASNKGILLTRNQILDIDLTSLHLIPSSYREERDSLAVSIVELLLEFGRVRIDLNGHSPLSQSLRHRQDVTDLLGTHIGEKQGGGRLEPRGELVKSLENIIYPVSSETDSDSRHVGQTEYSREIVVTTSSTNTSDGEIKSLYLEDSTRVVVQATGERKVDLDRSRDTGRIDKAEKFLKLVQALKTSLGNDSGGRATIHQGPHRSDLLGGGSGEFQNLLNHSYSAVCQALLPHLVLNGLKPDLVQLVYGYGNIDNLVRESADLRKTGQDLAVVDLDQNPDIKQREHPVHNLDKFQLIDLGLGSDDIHIALVELTVAALLRAVSPPDRLDLETLEREGKLILMLDDIPCERHCQVIT